MTPDKGYGEYQVPTAPEGKAETKLFFFSEYDGFFYKENYQLVILILVKLVAQKVNTTVFIYIYKKEVFDCNKGIENLIRKKG